MIENVSTQLTVFHCLCPLPASRKGLRLPLRSALFWRRRQRLEAVSTLIILPVFCHLLIFFSESTFSKKSFRNTIRVSNSLDTDQAQHFVWPDLGPNCLERFKDIYSCPKEIIKGLTDKGQFQYLTKLKGPQEGTYLYTTKFLSLRPK